MKECARYLRQIPQASENCMRGYMFVITGSLDTFKRYEMEEFIRRHGGRTVSKVDYIVMGDTKISPSKLAKADNTAGIRRVFKGDLLEMIREKLERATTLTFHQDFHLFGLLKKHLAEKRYATDAAV